MNKDQMIKWGLIVGGGVLAYWYVTSYGPNGPVSAGSVSWWDTWFGAGTPAPAPGQTSGQTQSQVGQTMGPMTQPVLTQPSQAPVTAPVVTPAINQGVKQQIVAASSAAGANQPGSEIQGGYAVPSIWSYFWQQVTGHVISPQQMGQMFPGSNSSAPMTLDQFLSALPSAGLSGVGAIAAIVATQSAPSIPSMNFGGSFRRPGMRGMGGRGSGMGGPTIQ